MRAYIIRRVLLIIPTLFLVTIIVFLTVRFIPGSLIDLMASQSAGTGGERSIEEIAEEIRHDLGLDQPIHTQYLRWLGAWPQNEWGWNTESSVSNLSVTQIQKADGEATNVRVEVSNTGDATSDYEVVAMLNGTKLEAKQTTIKPGASEIMVFSIPGTAEGTYTVEANGFSNFAGVLQGNLGESLWTNRPILGDIINKIPISLELGIIAIVTGLLISFPIGIYSAIRQDSIGDYVGRSIAILFMAVPGFWLGTMIVVFPAKWWGWTPSIVYHPITEDFGANIIQFIIPGFLMGMVGSGVTMRMMRTMMLEVLRQDYIRTAWSKGLRERVVVVRHAMKNAMIPVITIVGLQLPVIIGGTVIMEQIFNLPGMGRFMIESLSRRDYSIISGLNLMMASVILVANLLVDLTYGWLDPRIRYR
jgi:peptide/nickel transport system permease protein